MNKLQESLMNVSRAKSELSHILQADIGDLVVADRRVVPPAQAGEWQLPETDLRTLSEYGLPGSRDDDLMGVVAGFQPGGEPKRVYEGSRFYGLGSFGSALLAAQEVTGRVFAFPEFTEVHPQLRHLMPGGPVPVEVNSHVAALVECAWRWDWMMPILAEQEVLAGKAESEAWHAASSPEARAVLPDFYAQCRELGELSLAGLAKFDADIVGTEESFWAEAVLEI
ncbi:SUKH-4 family immunity protein [Streptomyces beihaiensis]|uniref:SUKH-4 family immunity protein n=1 Tax=Streptomyces beihaiensis TaxID=2984495 RepID=A0ABT3U6J3_9ACTN|nr:SUKH-4 family immunity protein [Streptomyces beihaiensis]MCX3064242.1 SUKH-4 family immunity protein [Streptomyces beihaiensis]